MSTVINTMVSFSGFIDDVRYTEATGDRKARLSIRVYDRHSWKDAQGNRQQAANYDSITVVYWGRTAQAIHQLLASQKLAEKDPVVGTGYLDDDPDAWIGRDDQQPHARIRVDGRSLCPDPLRQSFIDQANARRQAPAPQQAPAHSQQQAPQEPWPTTPRPGTQAPAQPQQPAATGPAGAQPDWMR
ncbi:MAG: hypothetical protein M3Z49_01235 [Bifidobacteriales bacterium]|nr:hypothetical protein [Bifidobacteriales bacterium]